MADGFIAGDQISAERAPIHSQRIRTGYEGRAGYVHREVQLADGKGWYEAIRRPAGKGFEYLLGMVTEPSASEAAMWQAKADAAAAAMTREGQQRTKRAQVEALLAGDPMALSEEQFRRLMFRIAKHVLMGGE